ncbi:AraC family transcriptional regulator [Burkholderia cepacia]|uniref:AraC family transcriptional regulator n=1 Tax=Burkholderia cepacia TaxID=292 RepID=UPI0020CA4149|nr:AraC family transcriptional regulator [Burkholderia cepacia]
MVEPSFGLVVQGTKRIIQSGDVYLCDANRFLITSLDLPGSTQAIEASRETPFLGIGLKLDFRAMAELMAQVAPDHEDAPAGRGLVVGDMTEPLYDAVNRLLALLDDPNAIAVLAPYVEREIYYRLLVSRGGVKEPGMGGVMAPAEPGVKRGFERFQGCGFLPFLATAF